MTQSKQTAKQKTVYKRTAKWFYGFLAFSAIVAGIVFFCGDPEDQFAHLEYVDGQLLNRNLLSLPENRWIEIYPSFEQATDFLSLKSVFVDAGDDWHRQGHAGLAFDGKRKSLLTFGSDSHGENWDNSVHEFNLLTLKWIRHYPPSAKASYRADENGNAVAGDSAQFPWAMHTYDNIAYVPEMDALVVTSKIDHTPAPTEQAKQAQSNPTWIYDLESREWSQLQQKEVPSFFAAGSEYDPISSRLWAYKRGTLWQLDTIKREWKKTQGPHQNNVTLHFTMAMDTRRHQMAFFGNYNKTNAIWMYSIALLPEEAGQWEQKQPGGDSCPKDEHFPVAYDSHQDAFLLVPDENGEKSVTLMYLPESNEYIRVAGADMPANGMNYMMVYDPFHRLFFMVTGDWKTAARVWAFRLNKNALLANR